MPKKYTKYAPDNDDELIMPISASKMSSSSVYRYPCSRASTSEALSCEWVGVFVFCLLVWADPPPKRAFEPPDRAARRGQKKEGKQAVRPAGRP